MTNLMMKLYLFICMITSLTMVSCSNNQIQQFLYEFNADWAGEKIDNITMLRAEIEGDNIIFSMQINNMTFGDDAQEMADKIAESDMCTLGAAMILESFEEDRIDICSTNYNIILRYYDSSGESIDIIYENSDLKSYLGATYQIDKHLGISVSAGVDWRRTANLRDRKINELFDFRDKTDRYFGTSFRSTASLHYTF